MYSTPLYVRMILYTNPRQSLSKHHKPFHGKEYSWLDFPTSSSDLLKHAKYPSQCKHYATCSFCKKPRCFDQVVAAVMPHFFNVSLAVVTLRPTLRGDRISTSLPSIRA
jgi:hypothetical protein